MNNLQTQVYKLNLDYFYNNFLNQELWGKKWTIFKYDNVIITIQLHSIEIEHDKIYLKISGCFTDSYYSTFEFIQLPINNRNDNTITKSLHSKVLAIISVLEKKLIRATDLYQQAEDMDEELTKRFEDEANEILDSDGVQNEDIRTAFVDTYIDGKDISQYTDQIEDMLRYQYLSSTYLAYCLFVKDDDKYEFYKSHITVGDELSNMIEEKSSELFGNELEMV